jgi:hypothetical protein
VAVCDNFDRHLLLRGNRSNCARGEGDR